MHQIPHGSGTLARLVPGAQSASHKAERLLVFRNLSNLMSSPLLAIPSLDDTYGAILLGLVGASTLFGFSTVQSFIYLRTHTHEARFTLWKVVVWVLWFLDALHLAFIVHMTYVYLITDFANLLSLTQVVWSFKAHVVVAVLMVYSIHILYIIRLRILSDGRSKLLPNLAVVVIIPLITATSIMLLWATFNCNLWSDLASLEWAVYITFATTTMVDIFIAGSLCYLLASARTGFAPSDSIILKIMAFVLDTGLFTSICSLTIIITCAAMPHNFVFLGIDFAVIELYINSFLAMMNARHYIRADRAVGASVDQLQLSRFVSKIPPPNMEAGVATRKRSASDPFKFKSLTLQDCGRDLSFPGPRPGLGAQC